MKKVFYLLLSIFIFLQINVYAAGTLYLGVDGKPMFIGTNQTDVLNNTGTSTSNMTDNNANTNYGLSAGSYIGRFFNERVNVNGFRITLCPTTCTAERQLRLRLFNQSKNQIYTHLITKADGTTTTGIIDFPQQDDVYGFTLQALNNSAGIAEIDMFEGPDITPPSVPTLSGTAGNMSITLNWTKPTESDLSMYRIYSGGSLLQTITNKNTLTYTINGLTPGSTQTYTITSIDTDNNESAQSNTITLTVIDTQEPTQPTNLFKSEYDNTIQLSWTPSTDNHSVSGYKIYRENIYQTTVTSASYTDTGLVNLINYEYKIIAYDPSNNNSSPAIINAMAKDVIPPYEPTNITFSDLTETSINLIWSYTSYTGTIDIDFYRLQKDSSPIITTNHNGNNIMQHNYLYNGLVSGQTYTFKVWAVDDDGNQSSNPKTVTVTTPSDAPATPTGLTVDPDDNLNTISWTANTESDLAGYKLYITGNNTPLANITTGQMYAHSPLANLLEKCYQITAYDVFNNESNKSNSVCGTPTDYRPPFDVQFINTMSSGEYSYTFSFPPSTSPDIDYYEIKQNNVTVKIFNHVNGQASYSYTALNLSPNVTYNWVVLSIDDDGLASNGQTHSYTPVGVPPDPPTGLTATAQIGSIQLSWDPHPDPDGDLKEYVIYQSTDDVNYSTLTTTNTTSYTFSTSSTSTFYFQLKAKDNGNTLSSYSNKVSSSALPVAPQPPINPVFNGMTSPISATDITTSGFDLMSLIAWFLLIPIAIWFAYKAIGLIRKSSDVKEKTDKNEMKINSTNINDRSVQIRKELQESLGVKIKK